MNYTSQQKVVIIGGYGTFGSLISDQLAKTANLVIAGRTGEMGQRFADSIGAAFSLCDTNNETLLRSTVRGARVVVNASGPFVSNNYSIPKICIEENCHYIDLADDREYVTNFRQLDKLAKEQEVFACTGASTSPAVTYALLSNLVPGFQNTRSIRIYLSAGNKNKAGVSTFETILSYAGTPVRVRKDRQWKTFMGWGLAEIFDFPLPVGKRFVQLCNVSDLELFPELFEADEVIFKAGVELPIFNLGLSVLAHLKKQIPQIDLVSIAGPLVRISGLFKQFGTYSGGVLVNVEDQNGNSKSLAFVTNQNGPRIPTSPAVLLAKKILKDGPPAHGAFPCIGFVTLSEFRNYLEPFGIRFTPQ